MARPKKYNIDTEQVEKLAGLGCTNVEIASFFGDFEDLIVGITCVVIVRLGTKF